MVSNALVKAKSTPSAKSTEPPKKKQRKAIGLLNTDFHVPLLLGMNIGGKSSLDFQDLVVIDSRLQQLLGDSGVDAAGTRFKANLAFLAAMKKWNEVRDFLFLEIYAGQLWKGSFRSLEDFIDDVTGITRGTFYKAVDKAEIRLQLAREGIEAMPTVRQSEQLARVPKDHRVRAWKAALDVFSEIGSSEGHAKYAFLRYCHENGIPYGRTVYQKMVTSIDVLVAQRKYVGNALETKEADGDVRDPSASEIERVIADALPPKIRDRAEKLGLGTECGRLFVESLRSVAAEQPPWDADFDRFHDLLVMLKGAVPELAEGLMRLAVEAVFRFAEGDMFLRVRDGQIPTRKAG